MLDRYVINGIYQHCRVWDMIFFLICKTEITIPGGGGGGSKIDGRPA